MKTTLLYIHGLGSDRNSRKFINLKEYFKDQFDYDFVEWNNESNIAELLNEAENKLENLENPIIVGDSTGANFAYQLRESRKLKGKKSILILSSPLLNIDDRIADFEFPKTIIPQLIKIKNPSDALIIATKSDAVLDQNWLFEQTFNSIELIEVEDNHRLEKFHKSLPEIEKYCLKKQ
ncbi:YqiA/YcfP family alpha/beta fold hydrolase [Chryseobacterium sp.]|uniref:YqiA/YcfP family alpha/beta fold hydrolase n=1 Tax=Chryseobacterium sp. TaxID=1871047 RepID=UPI00389025FD